MYILGIYMYVHIEVLYILYYTQYSLYKYMYILISPESQQDFMVNTVIKNSVLSLHSGDFFYGRSNTEETEEAISKFMSGLEGQEASCFESLHTLLGKLPVPAALYVQCIFGSRPIPILLVSRCHTKNLQVLSSARRAH